MSAGGALIGPAELEARTLKRILEPSPFGDFLTLEFKAFLAAEAYNLGQVERSRTESHRTIGERTNLEWASLDDEYRGMGISQEMFYSAVSQQINKCAGLYILTGSGETLRRWCSLAAQYAGVDPKYFRLCTSDHLLKARQLANAGKVKSPQDALDKSLVNGWTADEMYEAISGPPDGGAFLEWLQMQLKTIRESDLTQLPFEIGVEVQGHLRAIDTLLEKVNE